jgi:hypothetical protein
VGAALAQGRPTLVLQCDEWHLLEVQQQMLGDHLTLMRWVVTGVIAYAAFAMLRSAWEPQPDAPVRMVAE